MSTPSESLPPESLPPSPGWATRHKRPLIVGLIIVALLFIIILAGLYYIRSERFNRFLVQEIENALLDYGLRAEIGEFKLQWRERNVRLGNVRIYNRETGQLIATVKELALAADIPAPFAPRLRREVVLKELDLNGLDLYVEIDAQNRNNFRGVNAPEREPGRITVDFDNLVAILNGGAVHLNDQAHDLQAVLNDLRVDARPVAGTSSINLRLHGGAGQVKYQGREAPLESLEIVGRAGSTEATLEHFSLESPLVSANLSGKVENKEAPQYGFDLQAKVKLAEAARVFSPESPASGVVTWQGRIDGTGAEYRVNGDVQTEEAAAAGVRVRGLRVEKIALSPNDGGIKFSSSGTRAQAIAIDGTGINSVSVGELRGEFRNGRLQVTAPRAAVSRV
ncbi:MAG TPA: hypothetical protein VJ302_07890, partial [Blastocatellia bacterium]|nr:hypothetical protein [Blastocatellia bacterium]